MSFTKNNMHSNSNGNGYFSKQPFTLNRHNYQKPIHMYFNGNNNNNKNNNNNNHSRNGTPSPKRFKPSENRTYAETSPGPQRSSPQAKSQNLIEECKKKLPVCIHKNEILHNIKRFATLIILADTGSGKSTQIPQLVHSSRLHGNGCIAITQPRRVAAISLATRVSKEIAGNNFELGGVVGYTVRFEDATSIKTKIKYLTDGMLLREAMLDKFLKRYSFVILDEAHERTVHTDVLFGIVKRAQKLRLEAKMTPLKIIIMSATMDVDHFSEYFDNCKALYIEGRSFPVTIFHAQQIHNDYQTACIQTFFKIHREAPPGHDVLMFLTGQDEIETAAHQIRILARDPDVMGPPLKVFTLYAAQTTTKQITAFQSLPGNMRKLVISTNIAETSVTISGIKYVIDCGMVKVRSYHPATGMEKLKIQRISQQQVWQRTGRAGRESEGACYRVFTKSQYDIMQKSTVPEIQRCNLTTVCLQLMALGIHALTFDFMDKPPVESITAAFEELQLLKAVDGVKSDCLTAIGKQMVGFPLSPRFTKILLAAPQYGCLEEVLTLVAVMSVDNIFCSHVNKKEEAREVWSRFSIAEGDHVALLNIYKEFDKCGKKKKMEWCHENFVNMRNLVKAREVRNQLQEICTKCDLEISSCDDELSQVKKCLLHGLFMNIAQLQKDGTYLTLDKSQPVLIHPSSLLYGSSERFLIFTEVVQTSKCYIKQLTRIKGCWLQDIISDYINRKNIKITLGPLDYEMDSVL